jgi:hypothetical protein
MGIKIPTFNIQRPNKISPNWDFWFENIPSGNPGSEVIFCYSCPCPKQGCQMSNAKKIAYLNTYNFWLVNKKKPSRSLSQCPNFK